MDLIRSALGTKFSARWGDLVVQLALDAVRTVSLVSDERTEVDIKRYAKVEKVSRGEGILLGGESGVYATVGPYKPVDDQRIPFPLPALPLPK